jgi:Kef-type K+ transport system membrane component KefB
VDPIRSKLSSSKRNIKEVIKRIFRTFELLLGIFFVIIGAELFLFVHEETVFGVIFFLIGVGFLLSFYTTRKRTELKPINNYKLSKQKGGDESKR